MASKTPSRQKQRYLLYPDLLAQLNPKAPLFVLARTLPGGIERECSGLHAEVARPAKPVRLIAGLFAQAD